MNAKCAYVVVGYLLTSLFFTACIPEPARVPFTDTAVFSPTPTFPYIPMFSLTQIPPTITPRVRPLPPLPDQAPRETTQPIPRWLASVSPSANSLVRLIDTKQICIRPAQTHFVDCPAYLSVPGARCSSPLLSLFAQEQRVHNHLFIEVNGIVPSELTWQNVIVPNSTHPGTAWPGIIMQRELCWIADVTTGLYQVTLHYPTETGNGLFKWYFVVGN